MNVRPWKFLIVFGGLVALAALAPIGHTHRAAAAPDWKAVEQAIGKSGQLLPGGVYRIGFPRTATHRTSAWRRRTLSPRAPPRPHSP